MSWELTSQEGAVVTTPGGIACKRARRFAVGKWMVFGGGLQIPYIHHFSTTNFSGTSPSWFGQV